MLSDLKLAFQTYKKNWQDYLAVSFIFGVLIFIGVLIFQLTQSTIGMIAGYILIIIPSIISLKFLTYQSHNKNEVEYKGLKIGFITLFKSIKIYLLVVLKPILIALLINVIIYSMFFMTALDIASETMPNLMNDLTNNYTLIYALEEMLEIEKVNRLLSVGSFISLGVSFLVYFCLKLKRDFIPFLAFEMPITAKRAIDINDKVLNKKYFKFLFVNLLILLMFLIPVGLAFLTRYVLSSNEIYSNITVALVTSLVLCISAGPVAVIKQLHYVYSYKSYSKPYKEDFDNELKNVIKEIEELQKIIKKNDEK